MEKVFGWIFGIALVIGTVLTMISMITGVTVPPRPGNPYARVAGAMYSGDGSLYSESSMYSDENSNWNFQDDPSFSNERSDWNFSDYRDSFVPTYKNQHGSYTRSVTIYSIRNDSNWNLTSEVLR